MKTRLIILTLFILLFSNIFAQNNDPQVFNLSAMDTIWLASNNKVCKKDTATYYKLYRISDEPGLYTVNQYYITGELYMTGRVTSIKPEIRDGDFYWFYLNGNKRRKVTYKDDKEYNTLWWDPNGVKKLVGPKPVWNAEGKLVDEACFFDKYPEFPGGEIALQRYIKNELNYPYEAKRKNVEGRVIIRMIIDERGKVTYAEVLKKINPYLEAEALRVVRKMPLWSPAMNDGSPVSSLFTIPIVFRMVR
jgi:TonB family protein